MKPDLASTKQGLQESSSDAEKLILSMNDRQWSWSPEPGAWPPSACIEHLNQTNRLYVTAIRECLDNPAAVPSKDASLRYGLLERWFVKSLEPPVKRKWKAPRAFVPVAVASRAEALGEWNRIHADIMALMERADPFHLSRNKVTSPVTRFMKISLGMAFALMAAHNRRHLHQAKEVIGREVRRAAASQS
jgi:hypothetical protein